MKTRNIKKKPKDAAVTRGTRNVFADLGFSPSEAAELKVKSELTYQIYFQIKELGLTQVKAAQQLGITQPDVSKLMNGRYTGYSVDRLLSLLSRPGSGYRYRRATETSQSKNEPRISAGD